MFSSLSLEMLLIEFLLCLRRTLPQVTEGRVDHRIKTYQLSTIFQLFFLLTNYPSLNFNDLSERLIKCNPDDLDFL